MEREERLDSFERSALERLRSCQWVAANENDKEFGRLMRSALSSGVGGPVTNWYLSRIDSTRPVSSDSSDWPRLGALYQPVRDDLEMLRLIVVIEPADLRLDKDGNWHVKPQLAIDLAASRLYQFERKLELQRHGIGALLVIIVLLVLARLA